MGRIILAEDDEILGDIVTNAFIDSGHAVGWLRDGESALSAMRFRQPHLAILDVHMPGISGIELLRIMRGSEDLSMVPVLMLTTVCGLGSQNIAYYDGADDYVTKPFNPENLIERAQKLIDKNIHRACATNINRPRNIA